jgi:uncharacterized Zn finger protein
MARYDNGWVPYVPVAERRRRALRAMERMRKKGHPVAPVVIQGRAIATTFWGKAWCDNLESYRDYGNRLPRGRTYVRNGSVVDLQIAPSEVTAMVSGSSIYKVKISIGGVSRKQWSSICKDCAGGIDSLVELLQGRVSKGVMERICRQDSGLFPKPAEIRFACSCPDYASLCKHVAAVLYGVGARLDEQPELLFRLRAVDGNELVAHVDATLPAAKQAPAPGRRLEADDLSALFGLDMEAGESAGALGAVGSSAQQKRLRAEKPPKPKTPSATRKATVKKGATPNHNQAATGAMNERNGARKTPARKRVPPKDTAKVKSAAKVARSARAMIL